MRVFFLSEIPCALSVAGMYLGLVDSFERSVELDPSDRLYCLFSPAGDFLPVGFFFDEALLFNPPPQIRVYHAEHFAAVYVSDFLRADQTLKVLRQDRIQNALFTLVLQGKLQLYFNCGNDFKIIPLPDLLLDCKPQIVDDGYLLRGKSAFGLLSFDGTLLFVREGKVLSTEGSIKAEVPFHDCLSHTALLEWKQGRLIACSIRSQNPPKACTFALALFECVLMGGDPSPYLSEALAPKAGALKSYLGDFESVVLTDKSDEIGLVYPRRERVFDVRYFRVELQNGKISNILPSKSSSD